MESSTNSPFVLAIQEFKDYVATLTELEQFVSQTNDFDYAAYRVALDTDPDATKKCLELLDRKSVV